MAEPVLPSASPTEKNEALAIASSARFESGGRETEYAVNVRHGGPQDAKLKGDVVAEHPDGDQGAESVFVITENSSRLHGARVSHSGRILR